jgi:hypothetical protein
LQLLSFNESHISSTRTLLRFLDRELDALAFSKQFKHGAANRGAMKEVLESGFIPDEPKALVD